MSKKFKLPKIGMRSIKTFIATILAMVVSNVLGFEAPFYATWTAFLCIQSSIIGSSEMAIKRGIGTVIGGVFSLIYLLFMPENIYAIPFGIVGIIYLCNFLEKSDLISIACVVFLVISFRVNVVQNFDPTTHVIHRLLETFIGIIIAMIVNYHIKPPNPFEKLTGLNEELIDFIKDNIYDNGEFKRIKNLERFRLKMHEFRTVIQFYHKEINSERHNLDIKLYMEHLTLFRSVYSHIFILNSIKEGMNEDIEQYHIRKLIGIKNKLLKEE
ncbi:FUSC family protein [Anaeromicrobium sediminis]|uniref:FUSC family protein n=1 Tax=Anaeromicrobium sediminis TaxID=1478221 RepID=A0A267MJU5_9FIRM|nr:aromatic acid exporter family protein [Anaeromicrobium sediminis]PAB59060.1 hypothetical protein CCE28_12825 [Anaeromicrobium sediminis]